jgi:hypothetical protein
MELVNGLKKLPGENEVPYNSLISPYEYVANGLVLPHSFRPRLVSGAMITVVTATDHSLIRADRS